MLHWIIFVNSQSLHYAYIERKMAVNANVQKYKYIHTTGQSLCMSTVDYVYLISICFSLLIQYSSEHTLYYVCIIMLPIYVDYDRVVLQGMGKPQPRNLAHFNS